MRIPFLIQQGKFRPVIRTAIEHTAGRFPVTVQFQIGGGYGGSIRVKIEKSQSLEFQADWESQDWTRFPARIRAAATAPRDTGHFGTFDISHQDGTVLISEA
jgi:hypothetical protein